MEVVSPQRRTFGPLKTRRSGSPGKLDSQPFDRNRLPEQQYSECRAAPVDLVRRGALALTAISSPKSSASSGLSAWQPIQKEVRPTGNDVGPDLAVTRDRRPGGTALTFRGGAVTLGERLRSQPGLEGFFVAPPGDHQPLIPVVGRLQQFVTLESVRIVNGSGACGESVGQLVTGLAGNSDGVDLDDGHPPIVPDDSRQHHGAAGHDHSIGHPSSARARRDLPPANIDSAPRHHPAEARNASDTRVRSRIPPAAEKLGVITYSPLGGGLLTGKYGTSERPESGRLVDDPRYVDRYDLDTDFATADQFTEFAKKLDVKAATLAVAWTMSRPDVTAAIIGARNLTQLEDSLAALDVEMTSDLREEISALSPARPRPPTAPRP
jgi:hypothetical protein